MILTKTTLNYLILIICLNINLSFGSENILQLKNKVVVKKSSISFTVLNSNPRVIEKINIFKNGTFFRVATGNNISISETNLPPGKHSYLLKAIGINGETVDSLLISGWITKNSFKWNDAFIYQIMTDRFSNGNIDNDHPTADVPYQSNWQGGDFKGIINKLNSNYFTKLGVTALWISSPVTNTLGKGKGREDDYYYAGYHSYWPTATGFTDNNKLGISDPIDKHFGTSAELKELVNLAHIKGIKIVADFVGNHVHQDAPLYKIHKKDKEWFHDQYVCGWKKPIVCWFTEYLPDFNFLNKPTLEQITDHAIWLIHEFDIDGFRLDAVKHMDLSFTTTMRKKISEKVVNANLPFYLVGETFSTDTEFDILGLYLGVDKLDGQFDFPLFYHISRTFFLDRENFRDLYKFMSENDNRYQEKYFANALMSNFLGNHDIVRALSVANNDFFPSNSEFGGKIAKKMAWENPPTTPTTEDPYKRLRMAQTFIFTSPGIPMIYQGDEFGMAGAHDPDNRRMMIFDNLNNHQSKTLNHLKKLAKIRSEHKSLRYGKRTERWINENILIYSTEHEEDTLLVSYNKNNYTHYTDVHIKSLGITEGTVVDLLTNEQFEVTNGVAHIIQKPMGTQILKLVNGNK